MEKKLRIMKVVDTRFGEAEPGTIAFLPGTILPNPTYGFTYRFRYRKRSTGGEIVGCGIVMNEEYGKMSPQEIELACAVQYPVTGEEKREYAERNDMAEVPE